MNYLYIPVNVNQTDFFAIKNDDVENKDAGKCAKNKFVFE
jgi:hypothetical protein